MGTRARRFFARFNRLELSAPLVEASSGNPEFLGQLIDALAGPHALYGHALKLPGISLSSLHWCFLSRRVCPSRVCQFKGSFHYVAVSMSEGGTEDGTVHLYEVQSGKPLPDVVPRVNKGTAGGSLTWNADTSGFYYTRYPSPGERPAADLDFFQQIYFHKLGTPVTQDAYILGKDFPRIAEIQLHTSADGRFILATVANGDGGEFEHFLLSPDGQWTHFTQFSDRITQAVFGQDQAIYLVSENSSPSSTVLRLPLDHPSLTNARTIVPAAEDFVESIVPTAHRLYVLGLWGGPSDVRVFDLQGHEHARIPVPRVSAV